MTDMIPTIEMNRQDGYADIDFTNPKSGAYETTLRLNPRELIALRDLLNKHFPLKQDRCKKQKYIYPEKYKEFGLTVGLCSCVQENNGVPEKDCEYCYGTGVSVYTNIDIPAPSNCPHWVKDDIYVKGFRCSLYRDTRLTLTETEMRSDLK